MKRISWLLPFLYIFPLLLIGKNGNADLHSELKLHVEIAQNTESYFYPYHDLPDRLKDQNKQSLLLFSYGSLIDEKSAGKTLSSQALATRRPAVAFGVKRVFDRDVPIKPGSQWGVPCHHDARGMLNVQRTKELQEFINGVLVEVPIEDITALLDREEGYDLMPVIISDWDDFIAEIPQFEIAYILHANADSLYVNSNIYPRPGYYELSRNAAKQYGSLFESIWHQTTFMADGETQIDIWEKWIEQGDRRTRIAENAP